MTDTSNLEALVAEWRAAHKETHDSPHFLDQYDYGTADGLNGAADELEAALADLKAGERCAKALAPCGDNTDRHGEVEHCENHCDSLYYEHAVGFAGHVKFQPTAATGGE